jgi:hypothetical protein
MTELGKFLVFQFKYHEEMRHLYWQKDATAKEEARKTLDDGKTLQMIDQVGVQCCQEATSFLGECGKVIEEHFDDVGHCSELKLSDRKWTVSCGIWRTAAHKPQKMNWKMQAGVKLPMDGSEIIVWLWGNRKAAAVQVMVNELNGAEEARRNEVGAGRGYVALARIPVISPGHEGFVIDRDELRDRIKTAFGQITEQKLDCIYHFMESGFIAPAASS